MNYPKPPTPITNNVQPSGFHAKPPLDTVLKLVAEFHALGLYPVPKRKGEKIAYWPYWLKRGGHVPLEVTEDNLRRDYPKDDVDGLILAVGKSLEGRLVVLDIDTGGNYEQAVATYHAVQQLSPTGYVVTTPSNGFHLYYLLPEGVDQLKPTTKVHWANLDVRAKNSLIGLPGSSQQYLDEAAVRKGVEPGHVGYYKRLRSDPDANYTHFPTLTNELYELLWQAQNPAKPTYAPAAVGAHNYGQTAEALARIKEHAERPASEQEQLVLECLSFILPTWTNKSHGEWLQMWMAAWHGSTGSPVVRDVIANSSVVWEGRPQAEVGQFVAGWNTHEPKEDGYTVASLMYLARKNGWLRTTGLEIPSDVITTISVDYIQHWTAAQETLPTRVLVQSQTGSGKTFNIRYLYERLKKPKTLILVPTTKLAIELANTLRRDHGLPVTLYVNPLTGRTLPAKTLQDAQVLVTTLQTFSSKVYGTTPLARYGLVYVEESDQLFQQFARGGGGIYNSHVSDTQARAGFAALRAAFENSGNVWCVDATMTKVTYFVAEQLSAGQPITVVKNVKVAPKSEVSFLQSKGEAYQTVLSGLLANKRVVVSCDTAQAAHEVADTMHILGVLKKKKSLVVTADTARNVDVSKFMEDVNAGAQQYDLLVYNSAMGSGVSITAVVPDVLVQICNYLTPRANLQLLNRYRQQSEVYVYFEGNENLYANTALSVLAEAYTRAGLEAQSVNIPMAERNPDAVLRSRVAAMAVGDETAQRRSAGQFYVALLEEDGRQVLGFEDVAESTLIKYAVKRVREVYKALKEELKHTWPETRPIDRHDPADAEMDEVQVAQGEIHTKIRNALGGNIPTDVPPDEIYNTVFDLLPNLPALVAFVKQGDSLKQAESYLADVGRAITTLANNVTLINLVSTVRLLYPSPQDTLTQATLKTRVFDFMATLTSQKDEYNAAIPRRRQKWDEVYSRAETDEERAVAFSKILLGQIGLKQRAVKAPRDGDPNQTYGYKIENVEDINKFLGWRYPDERLEVSFSNSAIKTQIDARRGHLQMFRAMTQDQQRQVMVHLNDGHTLDFQSAVEIVLMGDEF